MLSRRRDPVNYITFFGIPENNYFLHYAFRSLHFLHCTIRLLSCKCEPLTQGNGLNPNHDGSRTERDAPKQSSRVRVQCTLIFACCTIKGIVYLLPTHFLSVHPCKHGRRRGGSGRCSQRERYVQGRFLLVTMHLALCTPRDLDVAEAASREQLRHCRRGRCSLASSHGEETSIKAVKQ